MVVAYIGWQRWKTTCDDIVIASDAGLYRAFSFIFTGIADK